MINLQNVRNKIAAGIVWLDANHPDWVSKINLDTFDFAYTNRCILGQLSIYHNIKQEFGYDWIVAHGFDIEDQFDIDLNIELCDVYNVEWKEIVNEFSRSNQNSVIDGGS